MPKRSLWRERLGSRGRIADRDLTEGGQMGIKEHGEPADVEEIARASSRRQAEAEGVRDQWGSRPRMDLSSKMIR